MAIRKFGQAEKGQSLVEMALTLPVLLLLTLGTVDLGLGFKTYMALTNAAREGARWVSIYPNDVAGARARAAEEAARIGLEEGDISTNSITITFSPNKSSYTAGERVTVTVSHEYTLLFGAITGIPAVPFEATATMVVLYKE
jgi:Flp pilus assembly protein TadG